MIYLVIELKLNCAADPTNNRANPFAQFFQVIFVRLIFFRKLNLDPRKNGLLLTHFLNILLEIVKMKNITMNLVIN